jgi:hypothetical protein
MAMGDGAVLKPFTGSVTPWAAHRSCDNSLSVTGWSLYVLRDLRSERAFSIETSLLSEGSGSLTSPPAAILIEVKKTKAHNVEMIENPKLFLVFIFPSIYLVDNQINNTLQLMNKKLERLDGPGFQEKLNKLTASPFFTTDAL